MQSEEIINLFNAEKENLSSSDSSNNYDSYLSKDEIQVSINDYLKEETLHKIDSQLCLGYIANCNRAVEILQWTTKWMTDYHLDAFKLYNIVQRVNNKTYTINATESRITQNQGLTIGPAILLAKGGEKHCNLYAKQIAYCVANNMKYLKQLIHMNQFYVHVNTDTMTRNNVYNIRRWILNGVHHYLNLDKQKYIYQNSNGVQFDLRKFYIYVKFIVLSI